MCDCADKVDAMLAERNTRLTRAIVFGPRAANNPNLLLQTGQIETGHGKKKAVSMFLTYCPFCGVKYATPEDDATAAPESAVDEILKN